MHDKQNQTPSLQMMEAHQTSYRWVILALVWLLYVTHGFVGRSAAPLVTPMVAFFGVGGSVISIGAPKAISMWFAGKDRGTAVGIYMTGPWFGQMFVLAATNSVVMPLTGYSWRLTFVYYGLFCFGAALLWWFFGKEAYHEKNAGHQSFIHIIVRLFKVHNVQILLLAGFFSFAIIHGFANRLPKILENSGISPAKAGLYSSFPFLVGIPTVLIMPRIIPARSRGRGIAFLALLSGVATFLVIISSLPLLFGLFLYGISIPSVVPLLILILMETPEVGSAYMGSAGGIFFCISYMGGFFGPLIMGFLVDLTGLFLSGAVFLVLLGCTIFGLMFLLRKDADPP